MGMAAWLEHARESVLPRQLPWKVKESKISIFLGKLFGIISVILACIWCAGENSDDRFLGGLSFNNREKIFNLHPMCMVISLLLCVGISITAFRDFRTPSFGKKVHLAFNLLAKVFMIVGLRSVYISNDEPEGGHSSYHYHHFGTMHSWLGLTTSFLLCQQDFFAAICYLYPKCLNTPSRVIKLYKDYHLFFGKCAFAMAGCTMVSGCTVVLHIFIS